MIAPSPAPSASSAVERSALQLGLIGFRVRDVDAPGDFVSDPHARRRFQTFGVSLLQTDLDARSGIFSYHGDLDLAFAGGAFGDSSSTADITVRGSGMFGVVSGHDAGVFARGGAAFDLSGNRGATRGLVELPRLELGTQWMRGPLFFEVGPSAGLAVLNVASFDEKGADAGVQPTVGGFVVVQHTASRFPSSRVRLEVLRSETDGHSATGLVTGRGRLCAVVYGPFAACAEGEVMTAVVSFAPSDGGGRFLAARETATSFGLTLAFGEIGMTAKPRR